MVREIVEGRGLVGKEEEKKKRREESCFVMLLMCFFLFCFVFFFFFTFVAIQFLRRRVQASTVISTSRWRRPEIKSTSLPIGEEGEETGGIIIIGIIIRIIRRIIII